MNRRRLAEALLGAALFAVGRGAVAEERRPGPEEPQREASLGRNLLDRIHALLKSLQAPRLEPFLAEWPAEAPSRRVTPSSLPVLKYKSVLESKTPPWARSVTDELFRLAPSLHWGQSYPASTVGAQFLDNYGWTEAAGLHGPIPSEHVAIGFLMLGPATLYPRHRHEAEEIYVPVSGTAAWQGGDGIWHDRPPGAVIVHERNEPHAMRTSSEPLLGLYLWRSAQLDQKSRLDPTS
jgi:quercetin dioxygenase-like cupin family protein